MIKTEKMFSDRHLKQVLEKNLWDWKKSLVVFHINVLGKSKEKFERK